MRLLTLLLLASIAPLISGCFPIIATGAGATALMLEDRRTTGTYVEDIFVSKLTSIDSTAPTVSINGPTPEDVYLTGISSLNVSGTATDEMALSKRGDPFFRDD